MRVSVLSKGRGEIFLTQLSSVFGRRPKTDDNRPGDHTIWNIFFFLSNLRVRIFIAIVVVGLSGGRFSDEKGCCLSSKPREKNFFRGRMIELSTEMARVAEVDGGNFVGWTWKRESDRKCVNHARVHASAQWNAMLCYDMIWYDMIWYVMLC